MERDGHVASTFVFTRTYCIYTGECASAAPRPPPGAQRPLSIQRTHSGMHVRNTTYKSAPLDLFVGAVRKLITRLLFIGLCRVGGQGSEVMGWDLGERKGGVAHKVHAWTKKQVDARNENMYRQLTRVGGGSRGKGANMGVCCCRYVRSICMYGHVTGKI